LRQEKPLQGEVITLLHFARSGSDIQAGLFGPRTKGGKKIDGWIGNIGQIEELRRTVGNKRIDALIVSIGVNDVGFTGSLENLVKKDFGWGNDTKNRKEVLRKIDEKIAGLDANFQKLAQALNAFDIGQVYISEYPTAIFDRITNGKVTVSGGCEIFASNFDMDISPQDAKDLRAAAGRLNQKIKDMAKKHRWVYVSGIADEFAGHGYCMDRESFFVTAELSLATQGDTEGTMHPNGRGHGVIARQVARELRKGLKDARVKAKKSAPLVGGTISTKVGQNLQNKP
jgi:lysophospholipase L1-like esterase